MVRGCKKMVLIFLSLVIFSVYLPAENVSKTQNKVKYTDVYDSQVNVGLIRLKVFTPPRTILVNGIVETIEEETLKFQNLGKIKSILEEGGKVSGQMYNKKGNVIDSGTLIAQQYTEMDKANLEAAKSAVENAKLSLRKAGDDFLRNKKLVGSHAISEKDFEASEIVFLQAKSSLRDAYQDLAKSEFVLLSDYMYSAYDAVVNNVYQSPEVWYEGFKNAVTIRMMNPIAIKIPIRYISDINHLSEKPILYSPSSNTRINDWICEYTEFLDDKYYHFFIVQNEKISFYNNLSKAYEKIPKIGWVTKTMKFDDKLNNIAVPVGSIQTENGKEYVWALTEKDTVDKENVVTYKTFIANKVIVKSNERIKRIGVYQVIELEDSGDLKLNDTIMWDSPPKDLKDNDMVLLDPEKWKLAPGDYIKVLVKLLPMKTGFYVPLDSITVNEHGETFVTLKNNKMVKVNIEGSFANLKLISGKDLKEGTLIKQNPNNVQAILEDYYKSISVN